MEKTQFSVVLANRTGELAKLANLLAQAKVNVEALSISDGVHTGVVKLVVGQPEVARSALQGAGMSFHEQQVLAVPLPNRPGALAQLCAKIAESGHSIDYVYGSACTCGDEASCGCQPVVMLSVSDRKAVEALERAALWPGP